MPATAATAATAATVTVAATIAGDAADRSLDALARVNPMAAAELERELAAMELAAEVPADRSLSALVRTANRRATEQELAAAELAAEFPAYQGRTYVATKRNGETIEFQSMLSDQQLRQALSYCAYMNGKSNNFAASLLSKFDRLNDNQIAWAHKLANDWLHSRQNSSGNASDSDGEFAATFAAIVASLQAVKGRSKMIKLSETCSLHLSKCRTKVWVKNPSKIVPGNYGYGPEFLGTVTEQWGISSKIPDSQREQIQSFVDSI